MNKQKEDELEIFVKWTEFLEWLLPAMAKFPRKIRHTFAERIENLALDVAEDLQEARYSSDKRGLLRVINLKFRVTETTGSNRVNRGGGWTNDAVNCRSANRNNDAPGNRNDNLGFRLVSTSRSRWDAVHGSHPRAQGQVHLRHPAQGHPGQITALPPRVVDRRSKPAAQSNLRNVLLPFASDFHTLRRAGRFPFA